MLNFLWSVIEVAVWAFAQLVIVLCALGIYHGWKEEKEKDNATEPTDD